MPMQTITVVRKSTMLGIRGEDRRDEIEADVLGLFAIHETFWCDRALGNWTISHVPTGWYCLHTRTKRAALAARRAFVGSGLPWNFTDPSEMSPECRAMGREIKSSFEGK